MRRGRSFAYLTEPYQGRPVTLDPGRPLDNHIGRIGVIRRVDPSPPLSPPPPSAKVIIHPNVLQNEKPVILGQPFLPQHHVIHVHFAPLGIGFMIRHDKRLIRSTPPSESDS